MFFFVSCGPNEGACKMFLNVIFFLAGVTFSVALLVIGALGYVDYLPCSLHMFSIFATVAGASSVYTVILKLLNMLQPYVAMWKHCDSGRMMTALLSGVRWCHFFFDTAWGAYGCFLFFTQSPGPDYELCNYSVYTIVYAHIVLSLIMFAIFGLALFCGFCSLLMYAITGDASHLQKISQKYKEHVSPA